ncbi:MAG TPA: rhodanese-like domain-containing protein [Polyangiaceae bacterium]|nr:rhodanese-like domain-containing protein [Polyangiaceae bacterium]
MSTTTASSSVLIDARELHEKIERGDHFVLAEALALKYYQEKHLPKAIALPPADAARIAKESFPAHDTPIVVYCASNTCNNSHEVAKELSALGYTDVRVFAEGKKGWGEAGFPFEKDGST